MSAMITAAATVAVGGYMASKSQKDAADSAASAQSEATDAGLQAQREALAQQQTQWEEIQKTMAPYIETGTTALGQYGELLGLSGADAQQKALQGIESSPEFAALTRQGENALLQNASATGGLRGGNLQGALAQFRPNLLMDLKNQQMDRLAGLAQLGQATTAQQAGSATALGNQQMQGASNIANLFANQGTALANAATSKGQANANAWGGIAKIGGSLLGGFAQ